MILRVTVNDNDFSLEIKNILENIKTSIYDYFIRNNVDFDTYRKFNLLINPNASIKKTDAEKQFVVDIVTKVFKSVIQRVETDNNIKYYEKHLDIRIVDCYTEKWENGEVLYYFSTHDVVLQN